jgi:hypothetical protein
MRMEYLLISFLLLTACGGRSVNNRLAKDLIREIPGESLDKEDVDVVKVTQVSGSEAIAETRLQVAFRFEKIRGTWVVREVRMGHGQWEKVDNLVRALEAVKVSETGAMMDRIVEAIGKYRQENGALPGFKDYIGLSDLLSPKYLTPLIRLDGWRRPLWAERTGSDSIVVRSLGADGRYGTGDDIIRTYP